MLLGVVSSEVAFLEVVLEFADILDLEIQGNTEAEFVFPGTVLLAVEVSMLQVDGKVVPSLFQLIWSHHIGLGILQYKSATIASNFFQFII